MGAPTQGFRRTLDADDVERLFERWFVGDVTEDGEHRAFCPLCENPDTSNSPSASFNTQSGEWNCLKGNHGGEIFDLVQDLRKDGTLGGPAPQSRRVPAGSRELKPLLPPKLEDQDKPLVDWPDQLNLSPKLLKYLTVQRGLNSDTIRRFHIGHDGDRYTIPIQTLMAGGVRNVRRYKPGASVTNKILNIPGHGTNMLAFGGTLSGNSLPVVVAEGEWDALLTNQEMAGSAVAVTGTGGATNVPRDLSAVANRELFVAYDCDETGRKGAAKFAAAARKVGAIVYILDLSRLGLPADRGEDLSDFFHKRGGTREKLLAEMERLRSSSDDRPRFVRVSAAELAAPVPPTQWLVRDVWTEGGYGVYGGAKKTLKTYNLLALALAVVSGEPFLGRFAVPRARPVVMYLSEGGQDGTARRLQAIAEYMGLDLAELPLTLVFDSAPIGSDELTAAVRRDIADLDPGLVILDALYAFHTIGVEVSNLYARAQMLTDLQRLVVGPERSLIVADHFSKMRSKELDLDAVSQSGVAEWAQSWVLVKHRTPPNVSTGEFKLAVQYGGRAGYGNEWALDWNLGPLGDEGVHAGPISVDVRLLTPDGTAASPVYDKAVNAVREVLAAYPFEFTASEAISRAKGSTEEKRKAYAKLLETGHVQTKEVVRMTRDGRPRTVTLVGGERKLVLPTPNDIGSEPATEEAKPARSQQRRRSSAAENVRQPTAPNLTEATPNAGGRRSAADAEVLIGGGRPTRRTTNKKEK